MKLCMIGTGYVGLVSGVCFSDLGNDVICVDKDQDKINNLQKGIISIRPEKLIMKKQSSNERDLKGNLGQSTYLGTDTQFKVILRKDLSLAIRMQNSPSTSDIYKLGDQVFVSIDDDAARFLIN